MRTRRAATINDLRLAINCLPRTTRLAMLEGIRANDIIVGAYTDRNGVCPMLAAHRAGGRTSFIGFAKAWDRFAYRDAGSRRARRATERELLVLSTHLEASLLEDDGPAPDLAQAVAEHRELLAQRSAGQLRTDGKPRADRLRARPGDRDGTRELRSRPAWAWLGVFRRHDDYVRAFERLESAEHELREGALVP